jgi:hypothetical protein
VAVAELVHAGYLRSNGLSEIRVATIPHAVTSSCISLCSLANGLLLSIAKYSDSTRSAGILPAREKGRKDGGATKNSCHYILQTSVVCGDECSVDLLRNSLLGG